MLHQDFLAPLHVFPRSSGTLLFFELEVLQDRQPRSRICHLKQRVIVKDVRNKEWDINIMMYTDLVAMLAMEMEA